MPLIRFDLIEGRSQAELRSLLDTAHAAMVEAWQVPPRDRYQIVHTHPPEHMIVEDTGLGLARTSSVVVISITSRKRTEAQKQRLYALLAERLQQHCGLSPSDLMISIVENSDTDWSFGNGKAQFLTGEL
jgi:phenylpyruvate tautomerase PptA (4-oxalocrotonate tautomerase family)